MASIKSANKNDPINLIPTKWLAVGAVVVFLAFLTVTALVTSVMVQVFAPEEALPSLLAQDWVIDATVDEIDWGDDIPMVGTFECTPDLDVGASIQFRSSIHFVSVDRSESFGAINITHTPPVRADAVCSGSPDRKFNVLAVNMPRDFEPQLPTYAVIRYSAMADGYQTANAQTSVFRVNG